MPSSTLHPTGDGDDSVTDIVVATQPGLAFVPTGRRPDGAPSGDAGSVASGAEATHVGINPVILGEWQRRGYGRTPFRMQSARGLHTDYAGRPVLPSSQTVCGFAQGQGRVRQWPRRRPLPAVLEPVGSQRDDRQQFQLAAGNVEVGGQDFGRSTAGRRHRSGRIGRGCSSMALDCTSAAGGQRG